MTLQTSQTVAEKPGGWVSKDQNQVSNHARDHENGGRCAGGGGVQELQESGVAEWGTLETEPKPPARRGLRGPNAYPSAVELNRSIIHNSCNS